MHAYLHCLSHTPLVGFVDPEQAVLDEVNGVIADARRRIAEFNPELVVLFAPDHYNGFFYDVMPPFCLGSAPPRLATSPAPPATCRCRPSWRKPAPTP